MASEKILGYLDSHRNQHVDQLVEFLKIPSISSQSDHDEDTRKAAAFVADELKELGLAVEIIDLGGHPPVSYTHLRAHET